MIKKFFIFTSTVIGFTALFRVISLFSFYIGRLVYPVFKRFDPNNVFVVLTVHHICQAIITLFIIYLLSKLFKIKVKDFGFNLNVLSFSIKWVLIFACTWTVIQVGLGILFIKLTNVPLAFGFPLNSRNFTGYFLFEILLSGTSEEIMFRALAITSMIYFWKSLFKKERSLSITVILLSTVVFMLEHINYTFVPFKITHLNILQQLTVLIFGVFYGYLFVRTKSIVGPMLAHNLLNGIIVSSQLILFLVFK